MPESKHGQRSAGLLNRMVPDGMVIPKMKLNTISSRKIKQIIIEAGGAVRDALSWPLFFLPSYRMVSSLKKQMLKPNTIIDVGANVGQFTVAANNLLSPEYIHAFEPVPDCFRELRINTASYANVSIYSIGLGAEEGSLSIAVNIPRAVSFFLPLGRHHKVIVPGARALKTIAVKVSTMDHVFEKLDLVPPVLLKIDTQGFEHQVISGAWYTLKRVNYAILETSFRPMYEGELLFEALMETMRLRGFQFLRPVAVFRNPDTMEIVQMDALFKNIALCE